MAGFWTVGRNDTDGDGTIVFAAELIDEESWTEDGQGHWTSPLQLVISLEWMWGIDTLGDIEADAKEAVEEYARSVRVVSLCTDCNAGFP